MLFKKTLIIGLGLIGGSFAKALRQNKISTQIFACELDAEVIDLAKAEGVIDGGFTDLEYFSDEIESFDLVVIATPLSTYENIFNKLKKISAIVIDLGSVKDLKIKNLPKNFIGCHPIAGSQNSGFEFACDKLFEDKKFMICSNHQDSKKIADLAKQIKAVPQFIEAQDHDDIYALMSHLPQFLSFLTKEFSPKNISDPFFKNAFRLDESDPEIWSDIFAMNELRLEKFYLKFFDNLEKNIAKIPTSKTVEQAKFDEKFFEENFAAIFFRALIVTSYLDIKEIEEFKNYAGTGFKDFTSIIKIMNYDSEKLKNLIEKNRSKILKFFNSIS